MSGKRSFGVLTVYSDRIDFFTEDLKKFFATYANQASAALLNSLLFREKDRELKKRSRAENMAHRQSRVFKSMNILFKKALISKGEAEIPNIP